VYSLVLTYATISFWVCSLLGWAVGSYMAVSQVEKMAVKAHELRIFKALVTPILAQPAARKVRLLPPPPQKACRK